LKILIVSWYFPPVNSIGALRVGKFARFLVQRGHEIGVVAGRNWGLPETLPLGFALDRVAYARPFNVNAPPQMLQRLRKRLTSKPDPGTSAATIAASPLPEMPGRPSLPHRLATFYMRATNIPDNRIGWLPDVVRQAKRLCHSWLPNLIFGSGPPFTALLACRMLSRYLRVPWVAELRDRWADDPYEEQPPWRAGLDERLERYVLNSAAALATVTEPWGEFYRAKYGKPVAVIYNGYDPGDFPFDPGAPAQSTTPQVDITYTGGIYPGRRDPSALFEALRLLGPRAASFRVNFYGTDPSHVYPIAERSGVRPLVHVHPAVPYAQSVSLQWNADVLLLMQWNDPREQGNCPGKFFEYLASLRPILVMGLKDGVPASFIRDRHAGFFSNDPEEIARRLAEWAAEKAHYGAVRRLPVSVREGLARDIQFERLERFLAESIARNV
jgi:glycosyltransferase involved in cell wall biosynthesis